MSIARLAALALVAVLLACSSPSPVLYTIAPVQGPVQPGSPKVIVLQQISTAHYLERSQIVRSSENYRLDVMSNDWWGEPLSAMLSRVLNEELGQRLPAEDEHAGPRPSSYVTELDRARVESPKVR